MNIYNSRQLWISLLIMDIHGWIVDIHIWIWIYRIHNNSIMETIMDIHNSIMDIHNSIMDIHICQLK